MDSCVTLKGSFSLVKAAYHWVGADKGRGWRNSATPHLRLGPQSSTRTLANIAIDPVLTQV